MQLVTVAGEWQAGFEKKYDKSAKLFKQKPHLAASGERARHCVVPQKNFPRKSRPKLERKPPRAVQTLAPETKLHRYQTAFPKAVVEGAADNELARERRRSVRRLVETARRILRVGGDWCLG